MKTCIFIDGANFFGGLRTINSKYSDMSFDFKEYINTLIKKEDKIISIYYYNGSLKKINRYNKLYLLQQDFFKRLRIIPNFKVKLFKRYLRKNKIIENEYSNNCENCIKRKEKDLIGKHQIKGDDINLAIDMLKNSYENICDKFILISGDGDFLPVINLLKFQKKELEICYFENNTSTKLLKSFDIKYLIDKKICNKFFYRGEK
jgi:uncharacterized LabA/DUF88 family protein